MVETSNLIAFFITNFQVSVIYDLGWNAAKDWMAGVTGLVTAIAISIRLVEEKVGSISGMPTNWVKVATNVLLVAISIGLYFVLADLLIQFFNALYANIGNGSMGEMAAILDGLMSKLFQLDFSVGYTIAIDSIYFVGASLLYLFTYLILVFVIFAGKIAHACLVSFAVFWGAVALPMSITVGFKSLTAWRNIVVLCLIWPIVDSFLMYLVSGAFMNSLSGEMAFDLNQEISLGRVVFYLMVFSIMNMFLTAVAFSAPLVAQGLANGSGNVTSMVGGFAAAGVAAGGVLGKRVADTVNLGGAKGGEALKSGAISGMGAMNEMAGKSSMVSSGNNSPMSSTNNLAAGAAQNSVAKMSSSPAQSNSSSVSPSSSSASSSEKASPSKASVENDSPKSSESKSSMASDNNSSNSTDSKSSMASDSKPSTASKGVGGSLDSSMKGNLAEASSAADSSLEKPESNANASDSNMADEMEKQKKQAKKAAIINQQKNK